MKYIPNFDKLRDKLNMRLYYAYSYCPENIELNVCDVISVGNRDKFMYSNMRLLKQNESHDENQNKRYLCRIKSNNYFDGDIVNLWNCFLIVEKIKNNIIHMRLLNMYEAKRYIDERNTEEST